MAILGQLAVNLIANVTGFNKGFKKASKTMRTFGKQAEKVQTSVTGAQQAIAAIATGVVATGFKSLANSMTELNRQSELLGVSTSTLQVWGKAAAQAGMQANELYDAVRDIRQRTGEAIFDPSSEAAEGFGRLGLDPQVLQQSTDIIGDLSRSLAKISDTSTRIDIMDQMLGDMGPQMIPLLTQNITALREEMEKTGQIMSQDQVDRMDEANRAINALGVEFKQVGLEIAAIVAGPVATLVTEFKVGLQIVKEWGRQMDIVKNNVRDTLEEFGLEFLLSLINYQKKLGPADGVYHGPAGGALAQSAALRQGTTGQAQQEPLWEGRNQYEQAEFTRQRQTALEEQQARQRRQDQSQSKLELEGFDSRWEQ